MLVDERMGSVAALTELQTRNHHHHRASLED